MCVPYLFCTRVPYPSCFTGSPSETTCHPATTTTTMELFPTFLTQRNPSATVDFLSPAPAYPHCSELPTMVNKSRCVLVFV